MKLTILSRAAFMELLHQGFPHNTAMIRFRSPSDWESRDLASLSDPPPKVPFFQVVIPDLDLKVLEDYGYSYADYLREADSLADFIYRTREAGMDLICQCDYGQSRSAACAAAILQHFEGRGIDIFADYRYYPNQLVYHKVLDALEKKRLEV